MIFLHSTDKYLGLRLFAHSWSGPNTLPLFRSIYDMNQEMIRMTKQQLQKKYQEGASIGISGSCDYNLTLINLMGPSTEVQLKDEEAYCMGKASVSWHADSSLQDYSAIGVYHTLPTQKATFWDWKIALRKNPDDDNKGNDTSSHYVDNVQPVVVSTKSGDAYFLLGELNHTHQHMVLAGSTTHRISSTHRVAVVETDTYEYIRNRCSQALMSIKTDVLKKNRLCEWNVEVILDVQSVLTELEFQWIAQYWIQGVQHDIQHAWWQAPMRALEKAWNALERQTFKVIQLLLGCTDDQIDEIPRKLLSGLVAALQTRQDWRVKWDERRANKIYKRRIARPYQPVEHPIFGKEDTKSRLPKDLSKCISSLSRLISRYDKMKECSGTKCKLTVKSGKPCESNSKRLHHKQRIKKHKP